MFTVPQRSDSEEAKYEAFKNSIFSELRISTIGIITQVQADGLLRVKPIINDRIINNDGSYSWQDYPEIPDTPYADTITNPKVGDAVLLTFCDHDISGFIGSGGTDAANNAVLSTTNPVSVTQNLISSHSLSNAVAVARLKKASTSISPATYSLITDQTKTDNGTGISNALVKFIEKYEGFSADWYDDGTGVQTIGYGHTGALPSGYTAPLTTATAESLMNHDLASSISSVRSAFSGYPLSQNQFDAMADFAFNLGSVPLGEMAAVIKNGVSNIALKVNFELYCHAGGEVLAGLVKRRDAEWAMYVNGDYQV